MPRSLLRTRAASPCPERPSRSPRRPPAPPRPRRISFSPRPLEPRGPQATLAAPQARHREDQTQRARAGRSRPLARRARLAHRRRPRRFAARSSSSAAAGGRRAARCSTPPGCSSTPATFHVDPFLAGRAHLPPEPLPAQVARAGRELRHRHGADRPAHARRLPAQGPLSLLRPRQNDGWARRELELARFSLANLRRPEASIYFAAGLLAMAREQCPAIDAAVRLGAASPLRLARDLGRSGARRRRRGPRAQRATAHASSTTAARCPSRADATASSRCAARSTARRASSAA